MILKQINYSINVPANIIDNAVKQNIADFTNQLSDELTLSNINIKDLLYAIMNHLVINLDDKTLQIIIPDNIAYGNNNLCSVIKRINSGTLLERKNNIVDDCISYALLNL